MSEEKQLYDIAILSKLQCGVHLGDMANKRQWNSYKDIREFVCDDMKDTVCPKPSEPLEKEPAPKPSTSKAKLVAAPKRKNVAAPKRKTTASTSSGSNKKKA